MNAAGVADKSGKVNVITAECGELWTSESAPHMPAFQGNYVTQEFLDDEDGHFDLPWVGTNDLGATRPLFRVLHGE